MGLKHYKELDGVRAIAVLMVMLFHFFQTAASSSFFLVKTVSKVSSFGWTGVSLFFVLSGFLITRILLKTKTAPSYFLNFYARRTLRIFPLYYLFLLLYFFLVPILEQLPVAPFNQQIWYWVYLQNFAWTFRWPVQGPDHFWSLAVEEHYYLLWPVLVYLLDKRRLKMAAISLIVISIITRYVLAANDLNFTRFTFARLDELALGSLLAIWESEGKLSSISPRKFILLFLATLIPAGAIWVLAAKNPLPIFGAVNFTLMALAFLGIMGYIINIRESHLLKRVLCTKPFNYTGKISYGLYVYHPLCFYLLHKYVNIPSVPLALIVNIGFSFVVATLSYYLFEVRFLSLKRNFPSVAT